VFLWSEVNRRPELVVKALTMAGNMPDTTLVTVPADKETLTAAKENIENLIKERDTAQEAHGKMIVS
jgi:predicted O-methyltransferase YrrM